MYISILLCYFVRTKLLCCQDDLDFLAKVHCVRLAFDDLVQSSAHRNYFIEVGRNVVGGFLTDTNQDPDRFVKRFNKLTAYMEEDENWEQARRELTSRKVWRDWGVRRGEGEVRGLGGRRLGWNGEGRVGE